MCFNASELAGIDMIDHILTSIDRFLVTRNTSAAWFADSESSRGIEAREGHIEVGMVMTMCDEVDLMSATDPKDVIGVSKATHGGDLFIVVWPYGMVHHNDDETGGDFGMFEEGVEGPELAGVDFTDGEKRGGGDGRVNANDRDLFAQLNKWVAGRKGKAIEVGGLVVGKGLLKETFTNYFMGIRIMVTRDNTDMHGIGIKALKEASGEPEFGCEPEIGKVAGDDEVVDAPTTN